jgi:hypothetical protein
VACLDSSRRNLQRIPTLWISPLSDECDRAILKNRKGAGTPIVMNHFNRHLTFVQGLKSTERKTDNFSLIYELSFDQLVGH